MVLYRKVRRHCGCPEEQSYEGGNLTREENRSQRNETGGLSFGNGLISCVFLRIACARFTPDTLS